MTSQAADHRRATAERNVAAILDAAAELLSQPGAASVAAVAARAGVSRVTVYAHFPTWETLLEAVVERAVGHTTAVLASAELGAGPPMEALRRLIAAGWQVVDQHAAMAAAAARGLSAGAMARSHQAAYGPVGALAERGRADGSFRADVPAGWLVTSFFALIHACAGEVHAGRLDAGDAQRVLTLTVTDLFAGGRR
jgi:TetR/AcrR family transcriptional regulator, mexCD-oprJ operon repressor